MVQIKNKVLYLQGKSVYNAQNTPYMMEMDCKSRSALYDCVDVCASPMMVKEMVGISYFKKGKKTKK